MKAAILILFPLGLVAIAYACTIAELHRPVPAFETPDWTVDLSGRAHPTGFKSFLPAPANYSPPERRDAE